MRESQDDSNNTNGEDTLRSTNGSLIKFNTDQSPQTVNSPRMRKMSKHVQRLNMGDIKDDIHLCVLCLRAIMNNKVSWNLLPCIMLTYTMRIFLRNRGVFFRIWGHPAHTAYRLYSHNTFTLQMSQFPE